MMPDKWISQSSVQNISRIVPFLKSPSTTGKIIIIIIIIITENRREGIRLAKGHQHQGPSHSPLWSLNRPQNRLAWRAGGALPKCRNTFLFFVSLWHQSLSFPGTTLCHQEISLTAFLHACFRISLPSTDTPSSPSPLSPKDVHQQFSTQLK